VDKNPSNIGFFLTYDVHVLRARLATAAALFALVALSALPHVAWGQENPFTQPPREVEILGISVVGAEIEFTESFVRQHSGLAEGQTITMPGDPAISDAIRSIYRLGLFSDVRIVEERRLDDGVFLAIQVKEEPKLSAFRIEGVRKGHRRKLEKELPLIPRSTVRPEAIENAKRTIREFYAEKGHPLAEIAVERIPDEANNTVEVVFDVDRGPKVRVGEIIVEGNSELSDRAVRKTMKTKPRTWWKFWRKSRFDADRYEEDLARIIDSYNERGYYGARIVSDSVYIRDEETDPEMVVMLSVREGEQYHIRDIEWDGNSVYTDEQLETALGLSEGDVYNGKRFEENLYANKNSSDVTSLYLNEGHMRFRLQPTVRVVGDDSLDIEFDITEGEIYKFGTIGIAGNQKTKEHVIRRELATLPGQTFSRDAIQESIRRLMQLNYFSQESLAAGPSIDVDDAAKTVDLGYVVDETGSDQLELSGTWGSFGLILQLRFTFNNFSMQNVFDGKAWRPLPSGDGQKLSVGIQTNGTSYQQYSFSFAEPWFRGKPRQVGFSLSYSRINSSVFRTSSSGNLSTLSARTFYDQALSWPDRFFRTSTSVGYQYFNNDNYISTLRQGVSHQVTLRQTLSRNSTDHPIFPSTGSRLVLSGEIAPPIGDLVQYHKWRFQTNWNVPLSGKISLGLATDFGFLGSLTGERVDFERFVVGGSPFETSGINSFFGKDIIYMRGYPISVIGPRRDNDPIGGLILNKYTGELRWMAVQSPQLQASPYLFVDAANAWDSFGAYNPSSLFRSAGVGVRVFLPILGMVEVAYGRNLDAFVPIESGDSGLERWRFQFTIGQGFGQ
jgi:outer membrane protein insertion porin family